MSEHTRGLRRAVTRTLTAASLAVLPLLVAGACSSDSEPGAVEPSEIGRLQLHLTGTSSSSLVYQLRNATFSISGASTGTLVEVNTETQPDGTALVVELPPDRYEVFLQPGFYLEVSPGTPDAAVVNATLTSANPAQVTIQSSVVSPLSFVFRVDGGSVGTGPGVLEIGISVVEGGRACVADEFEPNDDPSLPAPILPGAPIAASLCDADADYYIFPSPVPEGETFAAVVGFQTALGDIDAFLVDAATGEIVASGTGVADNEVLFTTSSGGDYILQTFLFFDRDGGGNTYTVDVGEFENPAENACCTASPLPGCNDSALLTCVCEVDSFCCEASFDPICVSLALQCGGTCPNDGAESDCCGPSSAPGCTDQPVHDCVCALDAFCCSAGFDERCAALAVSQCGAQCL